MTKPPSHMKKTLTSFANWLSPDDTRLLLQPITWILAIATFFAFMSVGLLSAIKLIFFILFYCSIPALALYKMSKKGKLRFRLNHKSLLSQPLFYLAIAIPAWSFMYFGLFAWWGNTPRLDATGFNNFITDSKLPLSLLAMAVPLTALVGAVHRSIQTARQIEHNDQKQNDEDQNLTKETAAHYLEKAFEILENENTFTKNDRSWINASNLLIKYKKIKKQITNHVYVSQLQAEEDYWRAKFEILLSFITFNDLKLLEENKVHASMLFVIAEITTWSTQDPDSTAKSNEDDYFNNFIENLNRNPAMRDFIATREHKIKAHDAYQLISQSIEMPSAKQIFEEAVLAGPSDDPAVTEERRRRGLE